MIEGNLVDGFHQINVTNPSVSFIDISGPVVMTRDPLTDLLIHS